MQILQQHDPDAAAALQNTEQLSNQGYKGLLEAEGLPSTTTREQYMQQAVQHLLVDDVQWQYNALEAGFYAAVCKEVSAGTCHCC